MHPAKLGWEELGVDGPIVWEKFAVDYVLEIKPNTEFAWERSRYPVHNHLYGVQPLIFFIRLDK